MAEGGGLLNRCTTLKLYPGFESLPHRQTRSASFGGSGGLQATARLSPRFGSNPCLIAILSFAPKNTARSVASQP